MRAGLLKEKNGWEIANLTDDEVIDQTAALLIGGRLHVHIRTPRMAYGGGSGVQAAQDSGTAAFPLF
jgi:hypothetical protein